MPFPWTVKGVGNVQAWEAGMRKQFLRETTADCAIGGRKTAGVWELVPRFKLPRPLPPTASA